VSVRACAGSPEGRVAAVEGVREGPGEAGLPIPEGDALVQLRLPSAQLLGIEGRLSY
jgi:hypothetical protein